VTSGGYQRFFEVDGVTYSHILDPKTGRPADTDLTSVTIICEDATYADALSTALFVMGREDAISHWNSHQDFEMVLVDASGEVTITPSLSFTINPDYQEGEVTTLG
ncbi:MAG: FAD:protein FMN transferase, partial [Eubacteriales bacterium]